MSAIWILAQKDLVLLWRDKQAVFWMLLFPLVFAAFFGSMFSSGGGGSSGIGLAVVTESIDGPAAEKLVERLGKSDALRVARLPRAEAADLVRRGKLTAYLELISVPASPFDAFGGNSLHATLGIDPSRQAERGVLQGLLTAASFEGFQEVFSDPEAGRADVQRMRADLAENKDIPMVQRFVLDTFFGSLDKMLAEVDFSGIGGADGADTSGGGGGGGMTPTIDVVSVVRERTGPPNAFSISFPQSMLWAMLGATAGFAITLVRERASGTMVRLLTAPITASALLAGKALACFVSLCAALAILIAIGWVVFGVTIGSLPMLVLAITCVGICFTGLSMLFSAVGKSEQAVAGMAWGILIMFAMLGGGMVPQIAMPSWMLTAGVISPARWSIEAFEGAVWRGYSLSEMALPCAIPLAIGVVAFAIGTWLLRRESR